MIFIMGSGLIFKYGSFLYFMVAKVIGQGGRLIYWLVLDMWTDFFSLVILLFCRVAWFKRIASLFDTHWFKLMLIFERTILTIQEKYLGV